MKKRLLYKESRVNIDKETGEITSLDEFRVSSVNFDLYIQLYYDSFDNLFLLSSIIEFRVLLLFFKLSVFSNDRNLFNDLHIDKVLKKEWGVLLGVSVGYINNVLTKLVKSGMLLNRGRALYALNPKYFFKGTGSNRKKMIDLISKIDKNKDL